MRILVVSAFLLAALVAGWILWEAPSSAQKTDESAQRSRITIESVTLTNGLQLVVVPNHRVPAVSHTLWLKAGAVDEVPGASGVAHYLEHLLFKGTPSVAEGEYSKRIVSLGGNHNAFTGHDFTGYYVNIAKEHLATVMELEADRLVNIAPSDEAYTKERDVILEERKSRIDNRPESLFSEQLSAQLFVHHPYGRPIIGWRHEMEQLGAKQAMDFYRTHYVPGNMVLVVAGDVNLAEVLPLAEKYYGSLQGETPTRLHLQEPPALGEKRFTMHHAQVNQPRWKRIWAMPSLTRGDTSQALPLMLLAEWLGADRSSYLHRELVVKQKLATHIGASYSALRLGPGSFSLSAIPAEGVSITQLEEGVEAALAKLQETFLTEENIAPYKTQLIAESIFARDSLEGIGQLVGYVRMFGLDDAYIHQWEEDITALTPADIQQALQYVLGAKGSVTGELLPEPKSEEPQS